MHEGGVTIQPHPERGGWHFRLPDGSTPLPWQTDDTLADLLAAHTRRTADTLAAVDQFDHPDARTIRPRWAGEPFNVHDCVQALFTLRLPDPEPPDHDQKQDQNQDQQAA